jgi:hypothetical protein
MLTVGCGGSAVPVSGRVTLDGEPMADLVVNFQPAVKGTDKSALAPGSFASTDSEGRYRLRTLDGDGAIPGEHVVTLVYRDPKQLSAEAGQSRRDVNPKAPPQMSFKLPSKAHDGSLRFNVPAGGTKDADFAFESDRARKLNPGRDPGRSGIHR